ncbi:ankyrin repeat protein [Colletotrichum tofieldiae]|uniref:Ankyrin repeat protein n=1 Tax=Colletotrichum tofieldiae TaxID=708197 RepID=A0A166RY44_9PEZI|nr:ankyrin repeat protein [Colletotrichum tofieldiae]
MPEDEREEAARNRVDEKIKGLAVNIESQYKRTGILLKALAGVKCAFCRAQDQSCQAQLNSSSPEDPSCDLVSLATHSHREWKNSERYKKGIKIIREWRQSSSTSATDLNTTENDNAGSDRKGNDSKAIAAEREKVRNIIRKDHEDVDYAFKEDENTPYELERDINGYVIQWEVLRPWESQSPEQTSAPHTSPFPSLSSMQATTPFSSAPVSTAPREASTTIQFKDQEPQPKRRPTSHIRALSTQQPPSFYETGSGPEKYLKPVNENSTDYRFKGRFPDQRTTLQNLLDDKPQKPQMADVILYRKRHMNQQRVRYFHIPHNNMKEAIARYFNEESPKYDGIYRNPQVKTHNHMLLRPEYWRGQQHGGRRTLVHARHMRAICERISSNIWESEDNPDNLVLFMPFLHWEEDRKRDKMAKIIENETERSREEREKIQNKSKFQRVAERTYQATAEGPNLLKSDIQPIRHRPEKVDPVHEQSIKERWQKNSFGKPNGKHARNFVEFADGFIPGGAVENEHGKDGRKFLLDAARLYEAMSMYRDQQLVEKYLHHDPPLHPRRTLDQSYYWTLKTTKARDRDQVVYRGTMMDDRNIHRLRKRQDEDCHDKKHIWHLNSLLDRKKCVSIEAPDESKTESSMGRYAWDGHWEKTDKNGCDHCRGEIRKVSRIVMVDQLWMWILDRQTIITSFPKRYGTNKSDPSGVHKSIRTRIKNARKNQIRSVFDVALIILDECSNTFFDRTKTPDRHPQVMDIFAESIGSLQNKQTVSFQHLWHWTERASKIYNSNSKYEDTAHLHVSLLNINPEGKLQREIKDIIDELDIMIHVNNKQKEVIKRFVKNVENIYDPSGTWRDETLSPDGERDYLRSGSMSRAGDDSRDKTGNGKSKSKKDEQKMEREKDEFTWFRKQAYDLISDVGDRITELEGLLPVSASVILVSIIFAFWTYPRTVFWSAYKYSETWILVKFRIYEFFLWLKEWRKDLTTSDEMLKMLEKSVEKMKGEAKKRRREARTKKAAKSNDDDCQHPANTVNGREDCSKSISSTDGGVHTLGTK